MTGVLPQDNNDPLPTNRLRTPGRPAWTNNRKMTSKNKFPHHLTKSRNLKILPRRTLMSPQLLSMVRQRHSPQNQQIFTTTYKLLSESLQILHHLPKLRNLKIFPRRTLMSPQLLSMVRLVRRETQISLRTSRKAKYRWGMMSGWAGLPAIPDPSKSRDRDKDLGPGTETRGQGKAGGQTQSELNFKRGINNTLVCSAYPPPT